jgi:predicted transposase/invertase (TIGR01784 family)
MNKKLIRFDWAVKKLLRNKANFAILEGFLSELLFDDIRIEKILESEGNQETEDDKFNRVDILTQNSKNELIVVEIQNTFEIDFFHRMAYGASKALTENLSLGQAYSQIKKIISINIVYFDLGQGEDYVYKGGTVFQGLHQKDTLTLSEKQKLAFSKENVSDIFPEFYIIKVNKFNDIAKDNLDEWVYFLKNSEVKDEFKAKGLKEAGEVLDYMRLPEDDQFSYNRYLDYLHYKASEIESLKSIKEQILEGKSDGVARLKEIEDNFLSITLGKIALSEAISMRKIVEKSIAKGFDNQTISDLTDLTIEQIEDIRTNLDKK